MEKKINLVEILRYCPSGMELDCSIFDNIEFDHVDNGDTMYQVICRVRCSGGGYNIHAFTMYGCYNLFEYSKCVIFPKGKTTWEGFTPPCKFKDGDVLSNGASISIYNGYKDRYHYGCYVAIGHRYHPDYFVDKENNNYVTKDDIRFATEEEKQRLFQEIKDNGYKWNAETKTLEKLIEPKFKIGDKIRHKLTNEIGVILYILSNGENGGQYDIALTNDIAKSIYIETQDEWELVPKKFDITTLKPFDRVLLQDCQGVWCPDLYGFYDTKRKAHSCVGIISVVCIPYEGNEHLLGTTDDCDEFYKTWE